jgi:hypothetical protein
MNRKDAKGAKRTCSFKNAQTAVLGELGALAVPSVYFFSFTLLKGTWSAPLTA